VRVADLQEEPTKRLETQLIHEYNRSVGSDEGESANIAASAASHWDSEPRERSNQI
jgi:hypothetical protein